MGDSDMIAVALLALTGVALALATAAEAGALTFGRARATLRENGGSRGGPTARQQARERARQSSAFTVVRGLAMAGGTALLAFLFYDAFDSRAAGIAVAFGLALGGGLLLQITPQYLVVQHPDRWALALSPMARVIGALFGPAGWLFTIPARVVLHARGIVSGSLDEVSEAEQLLRLAEIDHDSGPIPAEEAAMIRGVMGLEGTTAREIMVPRIDMAAVEASRSVREAVEIIVTRGYSRIPVYDESIDNIVGVLYAKDLLNFLAVGTEPVNLRDVARIPLFIPESKRIDDLLRELRQSKVHIAIVVDEYGGTAGLVTIEDLLEEIVGEIEDEYDVTEVVIERIADDEAILDARIPVDELEELFGVRIASDDFDTVGGFVYSHIGKIPKVGDETRVGRLVVTILSVDDRRIRKVRVRCLPEEDGDAPPQADDVEQRVS